MLIVISVFSVLFICWLYWRNTPKSKGERGERRVAAQLDRLSSRHYHVFNNLYVGFSQIDHVVVSRYGIFVIETKNYSGCLHASDSGQYWWRQSGGKKITFYNPIVQNLVHVRNLQRLLKLPSDAFVPIVVIAGDARIESADELRYWVVRKSQVVDAIKTYDDKVLSEQQVEECCDKLSKPRFQWNSDAEKQHEGIVRSAVINSRRLERSGICPRCGGYLVLHHGKYGDFYGCSNYPKCTYTRKTR